MPGDKYNVPKLELGNEERVALANEERVELGNEEKVFDYNEMKDIILRSFSSLNLFLLL